MFPDHRGFNAILVGRITISKAAFHTGVAVVSFAGFGGRHVDHLLTLDLNVKVTANAAVGTGGGDAVMAATMLDDGVFNQGTGWAGFDAGSAGNTI